LQFIEDAKKALDKGEKVYYSSWYWLWKNYKTQLTICKLD
jgi:hypothetical protein